MINEIIYDFTAVMYDTGTHARCYEVEVVSCDTGDPIYDCFEPCGDEPDYCNPVVDGDLLYFQTRFPDNISPDIKNPTAGWSGTTMVKGEMYDGDGNLITADVTTLATNYLNGHTGDISVGLKGDSAVTYGNFQNIIINSSSISVDCFYFAFYYKLDAVTWSNPIYTNHFCKSACKDTVELETELKGVDCFNMFHGTGEALGYVGLGDYFDHVIKFRVEGEITLTGSEVVQTEDFDDNITKTVTREVYTLKSMLVPPYIAKKVIGQILAGQTIKVDSVEYQLRTPPQKNNEDNRMFLMDIELYKECQLDFLC